MMNVIIRSLKIADVAAAGALLAASHAVEYYKRWGFEFTQPAFLPARPARRAAA
jgi:hypothetical protein